MTSPPLSGIRVLELAGLAPAPFAGMILSDFGADVVRVDPVNVKFSMDTLARGKRSLSVSLKEPSGLALLRRLLSAPLPSDQPDCWRADLLIDPFRPGVLERLGLDPKELLAANPKLIVARITGFRREGPYARMAGHDVNYLALSGVLDMLGRKGDKPTPPINLLADFGGGGLMAALGIVLAIVERFRSGKGQVVEVDMVTGVRYLSSFVLMLQRPSLGIGRRFGNPRGDNLLDTGAPFYEVYETKDGGYMSVGALEPLFYAVFLKTLIRSIPESLVPQPAPDPAKQGDQDTWPALRDFFTRAFFCRTRDDWTQIFMGSDACCVPVLKPSEVDSDGRGPQETGDPGGDGSTPRPRPTLTRSPAHPLASEQVENYFVTPGTDTEEVLKEAGIGESELTDLIRSGAVRATNSRVKL